MKPTHLLFVLCSVLILGSCGQRQSFTKQKFTLLKKVEQIREGGLNLTPEKEERAYQFEPTASEEDLPSLSLDLEKQLDSIKVVQVELDSLPAEEEAKRRAQIKKAILEGYSIVLSQRGRKYLLVDPVYNDSTGTLTGTYTQYDPGEPKDKRLEIETEIIQKIEGNKLQVQLKEIQSTDANFAAALDESREVSKSNKRWLASSIALFCVAGFFSLFLFAGAIPFYIPLWFWTRKVKKGLENIPVSDRTKKEENMIKWARFILFWPLIGPTVIGLFILIYVSA